MSTIQLRRGTAAAWTSANPTLAAGEPGFETDTLYFKIGNGSTAWNSLAYENATGPTGATGATGAAGPNTVTVATTTNLTGILFGDAVNVDAGWAITVPAAAAKTVGTDLEFIAGDGGNAVTGTAGAGGTLRIQAGNGGDNPGHSLGAAGGDVVISAGVGGTGSTTSGIPGSVRFYANGAQGMCLSAGILTIEAQTVHTASVFVESLAGNPPLIIKAFSSGSAEQILFRDSGGTRNASFLFDGSWSPPHIADASAANDSVYYSTDAAKLVYKDPGGTVRNLY